MFFYGPAGRPESPAHRRLPDPDVPGLRSGDGPTRASPTFPDVARVCRLARATDRLHGQWLHRLRSMMRTLARFVFPPLAIAAAFTFAYSAVAWEVVKERAAKLRRTR